MCRNCYNYDKISVFRGYELSEELCQQAKSKSREYGDTSWLDFHIVYGGFAETYKALGQDSSIRQMEIHFGPYRIDNDNDNKSFYYIKEVSIYSVIMKSGPVLN